MKNWQSIETAPKDGTDILVLLGNGEHFRARWIDDGYYAATDIGFVNATHWMTLPEPPSNAPVKRPVKRLKIDWATGY